MFERRDESSEESGYRESPVVYIIEIFLTILDSGTLNQSFFK